MINILKTELFRLKKSKLFWVLLCVTAGLTIFSALLILGITALLSSTGNGDFLEILGLTTSASSMLSGFVSFSSNSSLFALICSAIFLSREFTQGTMRNAVLANKNRKQLFLTYYIMALLVGGTYFIVEFLLTLAIYGPMLGFSDGAGAAATNIFIFFALGLCSVLFVQTCVTMFLFVTRKQSLTIVLPLLVCILGPGIVTSIINIIIGASQFVGSAVSETLLQCLPFCNVAMLDSEHPAGLTAGMIALYDLLFTGAFFCGGFFPFQKADLK